MSKKKYYPKDICTIMGENAFDDNINEKGLILFIDPCYLANWAHDCYYCFITKDKFFYSTRTWPWSDIESYKIFHLKDLIPMFKKMQE